MMITNSTKSSNSTSDRWTCLKGRVCKQTIHVLPKLTQNEHQIVHGGCTHHSIFNNEQEQYLQHRGIHTHTHTHTHTPKGPNIQGSHKHDIWKEMPLGEHDFSRTNVFHMSKRQMCVWLCISRGLTSSSRTAKMFTGRLRKSVSLKCFQGFQLGEARLHHCTIEG